MSTQPTSKWRVALNLRLMDDAARANLLANVEKMSPQCPLSQNPAVAASIAALGTKGAALAASTALVSTAAAALKKAGAEQGQARAAFDRELVTLKALIENAAPDPAVIAAMGLTLLVTNKASKAPPEPPASVLVTVSKYRGKARVTVQEKGRFAAELSQDPTGATGWTSLPGTGKARKLSGYASGAKLWVRFATVRYGMQSAWCTPVLVNIP